MLSLTKHSIGVSFVYFIFCFCFYYLFVYLFVCLLREVKERKYFLSWVLSVVHNCKIFSQVGSSIDVLFAAE